MQEYRVEKGDQGARRISWRRAFKKEWPGQKYCDPEAHWCFRGTTKSQWKWNRNKATKGRTLRHTERTLASTLSEMGSHGREGHQCGSDIN